MNSPKVSAVIIPDDTQLASEVVEYAPLAKGDYEVTVAGTEIMQIKSGVHSGKEVMNIKLKTATGRVLFKQLPLWVASENTAERAWIRMSRVAFVTALSVTNEILFMNTESLIGLTLVASVDAKLNVGFEHKGPQNYVVTFK